MTMISPLFLYNKNKKKNGKNRKRVVRIVEKGLLPEADINILSFEDITIEMIEKRLFSL